MRTMRLTGRRLADDGSEVDDKWLQRLRSRDDRAKENGPILPKRKLTASTASICSGPTVFRASEPHRHQRRGHDTSRQITVQERLLAKTASPLSKSWSRGLSWSSGSSLSRSCSPPLRHGSWHPTPGRSCTRSRPRRSRPYAPCSMWTSAPSAGNRRARSSCC